jgi:cobalamin biosynthesis protein CbiG
VALAAARLLPGGVRVLATLDRRAADDGVRLAAQAYGWELRGYPAAELAGQAVPHPSGRIAATVGTPSVAEAAALLAAGPGAALLLPKTIHGAVTVAIACPA